MRYTHYISTLFRTQGVPQLEPQSFATIMNIVHLEGAAKSLKMIRDREPNPQLKFKYDIWIQDYEEKVNGLTSNLKPELFVRQLR